MVRYGFFQNTQLIFDHAAYEQDMFDGMGQENKSPWKETSRSDETLQDNMLNSGKVNMSDVNVTDQKMDKYSSTSLKKNQYGSNLYL